MRKIILDKGELFDKANLLRHGAFDADALCAATDIVAEVRSRGDEAISEYTLRFDKVKLTEFELSSEEIDAALKMVDDDFMRSIELAVSRVADFHERQLQQSWFTTRPNGALTGQMVTPLKRVGIYVPGGRAQYPSTVVMNAVPAVVAGVEEIIMCTPCGQDGAVNPYTLAAAATAGVSRIFKVGGAQAVAAMAYGTKSIPRVDKITGPGNAYVAAAKKIVNGDCGIDMIAGPSEVCVLAGQGAIPEFIAIDLMAQAEHDPRASCYLVTTEPEIPDKVTEIISELLSDSTRSEITAASLEHGLIVVCPTLTQAFDTINKIAPEHLEICMPEPFKFLSSVQNAGAVFLGSWTPEAVGDYLAGPNHTLPTGGTALFSSPLSVEDFVKKSSVLSYSPEALKADASAITTLAAREGLWAHQHSVEMRMDFMHCVRDSATEMIDNDDEYELA